MQTPALDQYASDDYTPEHHGDYAKWEPLEDIDALGSSRTGDEPEPEKEQELMQIATADARMYMVKIPKHLMERWAAIDEEGVHLATLRFYHGSAAASRSPTHAASAQGRVVLRLPPEPDDDRAEVEEYEMDVSSDADSDGAAPFNEYVVAELDAGAVQCASASAAPIHSFGKGQSKRDVAPPKRKKRQPVLLGAVTHRCYLRRTVLTSRMRQQVKARHLEASTPRRQVVFLGHGVNAVARTRAESTPFILPAGPSKTKKGPKDRMVRLPKGTLLDMLFDLFKHQPRWTFQRLREETKQPEVYLREVLLDIAVRHDAGQYHGTWTLRPSYGGPPLQVNVDEDAVPVPTNVPDPSESAVLFEEDEDDEDEDDSESDLEDIII
ncbi:transcription initiation factor IIF, beta subunit-domain-containing protein [Trametes meyenii]|nr:transcription initiation factor IIF, beta subunit-domain-containing protein [Trametes meyenii]